MAHTSLYRKYRPATFDDVVGQLHIERTLRNAVAEGTVAHAYLFTGPRGTGKTTTARLLAKALLCERGPTGEPDGTCESCNEIAEGRHPDVYELDAASRTGVDNVREEIIGRVSFAPTRGRYKVYIIDEVHMLSTAAFNALLKTLEEPPAHVIFVMCTTHPQKVPETIQSRCQRFDFRRLSIEDIADRLRYIAEAEGMKVDRGAFTLIARHAQGGMRDAITSLEQLSSYTGGEITADDVEGVLGEIDAAALFRVADLIARRDIAGSFRWVAETVETGTDLTELVRALTGHVRDLFVIAAIGDGQGVVDRTAEDLSRLQAQAAEFGGPDRLANVLDLLGELTAEMRWSSDPRLSLEVVLTRMARPQGEMTLASLAERVEALEHSAPAGGVAPRPSSPDLTGVSTQKAGGDAVRQVVSGHAATPPPATQSSSASEPGSAVAEASSEEASAPASAAAVSAAAPAPAPAAAPTPDRREANVAPRVVGTLDRAAVKRDWAAVLIEIKKLKPTRVQTYSNVEVDVDGDGVTMVVEFPADQSFFMGLADEPDNRELLKKALAAVFGSAPPFRFQLGRGAVRPAEAPPAAADVTARSYADVKPEASVPDTSDDPLPEYYETASGMSESTASAQRNTAQTNTASTPSVEPGVAPAPATPVAEPASEIEAMILNGLGATIVGEKPARPEGEESEQ